MLSGNTEKIYIFQISVVRTGVCAHRHLFQEKLSEKVHATIPILWVVLSSLFFKEILNNGERGHGRMFVSAKGKQQKSELRQLQCQGQSIYHNPYYLSGLSRTRFFRQPFS